MTRRKKNPGLSTALGLAAAAAGGWYVYNEFVAPAQVLKKAKKKAKAAADKITGEPRCFAGAWDTATSMVPAAKETLGGTVNSEIPELDASKVGEGSAYIIQTFKDNKLFLNADAQIVVASALATLWDARGLDLTGTIEPPFDSDDFNAVLQAIALSCPGIDVEWTDDLRLAITYNEVPKDNEMGGYVLATKAEQEAVESVAVMSAVAQRSRFGKPGGELGGTPVYGKLIGVGASPQEYKVYEHPDTGYFYNIIWRTNDVVQQYSAEGGFVSSSDAQDAALASMQGS